MIQNRATLKQIRFLLLNELRQIYTENESESIARLILEYAGYSISLTLRDPDLEPDPSVIAQINEIVADIHTGKPIQYILGHTFFCDLKIKVNKNVLIPRPETEELLEHIKASDKKSFKRIIDLGTGSGCIALGLKGSFPDAEVWGVDINKGALRIAGENARNNKLQVNFGFLDLLDTPPLEQWETFDLVVSNPPYVMKGEQRLMADNVLKFEPASALFVEDSDPLIYYRAIASFCAQHLAKDGELWVEINEQLSKETADLFKKNGFLSVQILKDIHEKDRYVHARR
jgi:release factor glutamine methyltransferase